MSAEIKVLYEFGKFRCNPREQLLLCDGKPVSLSPKSFEVLIVLVQSNGRLLTKDELIQLVWPDSLVEEANLTVNVSALRKALGKPWVDSNISRPFPSGDTDLWRRSRRCGATKNRANQRRFPVLTL